MRCLLFVLLLGLPRPGLPQPSLPDACAEAVVLVPDAPPLFLSNQAATPDPATQPASLPGTCIESFENDLWFRFTATPGLLYYAVSVQPQGCNTPAGLQALLIQADTCDPATFVYLDCRNPRAEQPLTLWVAEAQPGQTYWVYVDGYDGTQCAFTIALSAYATDPREATEYRRQEMDFYLPEAPEEQAGFHLGGDFRNNETVLAWESLSRAEVAFFQVLLYPGPHTGPGMVLATLDPQQAVGENITTPYTYRHQAGFAPGQSLCYRVAGVDLQGHKTYSPPVCLAAEPVEDFFVSPVRSTPEKGVFQVHYLSKRKQNLTFQVLDAHGVVQKEVTLKRVGQEDGFMKIDMRDFAPGWYDVRVEGRNGFFQRRFRVE